MFHIYYKYMVTPCFAIPIKNIGHCGDTHSITYVFLGSIVRDEWSYAIFKEQTVCSTFFCMFPSCSLEKNLTFIDCIKPKWDKLNGSQWRVEKMTCLKNALHSKIPKVPIIMNA